MHAHLAVSLNAIEKAVIAFTNGLYSPGVLDHVTKEEIRDMLSSGQLMSKKWLLNKFVEELGQDIDCHLLTNVIVVGGWVGILAAAIGLASPGLKVDSLDINPSATLVADCTLCEQRGEAIQGDMYDFDYTPYQCVVNTSAEHIPDLSKWIDLLADGTFVVVQSNNARHVPDHVSCVDSMEELKDLLGLSEVYYMGELLFPMYTRYMVIGVK